MYQKPFYRAIRKHGFDSFEWNILYQSTDKDHTLKEMEQHFITEYNTFGDGYNLTLGGEGTPGWKANEKTRKKMSATKRGRPGRKPSEETRHKMSLSRKGRPGRKPSEETRHKMSLAKKDTKHSKETRNKMSLAQKGKLKKNSRQISTPRGIFDSVTIAATALALPRETLRRRLKSNSFPDWFYNDNLAVC
jgi:group I intron endonuclease